jgi:hypothetical protein
VRGPPDVQVMFKRSEGGERSRRRNGIARNMLRGESCCSACGGWDDGCCFADDDRDRAEPVLEFAVAGRIFDGGGGTTGPTRVTDCRRRTITGVGEDGASASADDDTDAVLVVLVWALVEVELLLLLVLGGAGGKVEGGMVVAMPKGVSSSLTLDEEATFLVAGRARD